MRRARRPQPRLTPAYPNGSESRISRSAQREKRRHHHERGRHVFLLQTPQAFSYDADGNLTNDGTWTLTWDAENRSKKFTAFGAVAGTTFGLASTYDYLGRRIQKDSFHTSTLPMTNWANTYKIVYDGWNPIAVLDADNNLLYSFMWGTDLSGTMQGAGGVGGLLAMTDYLDKDPATYFYAYDGNGNVLALVSAADGSVAAQYEYGPFGELIRASGVEALANPFRFDQIPGR